MCLLNMKIGLKFSFNNLFHKLYSPMSLNSLEFEGDETLSKGGKANPAPADKKE